MTLRTESGPSASPLRGLEIVWDSVCVGGEGGRLGEQAGRACC